MTLISKRLEGWAFSLASAQVDIIRTVLAKIQKLSDNRLLTTKTCGENIGLNGRVTECYRTRDNEERIKCAK